ncbi:MAG TPA: hypothetical protein VK335_25945 [Bryobacteraceae bacterium]|nr:hypothetical protein [Bryobacteraceae bacterium]
MKNVSVTIGLVALLLTSGIKAQDITVKWKVSDKKISVGYLPKVASDGIQNVVTIAETGKGFTAFEDELGSYGLGVINWSGSSSYLFSPPQTTPQMGHSPSIALAYSGATNYDSAIEVHQGGQLGGSSLWYQIGSNAPPSFSGIHWSAATTYDTGFNPTVAADLNIPAPATTATVVEVHQSAVNLSALWYHVGTLTLGPSPSISWGPALEINGGLNQGYVPTVSIANNLALLVAQGSGGTLWYAIGVVDTGTSSINWSDPIPYGTGYNPTVSVYGDGTTDFIGSGRVLVEAHQVDNTTGSLVYSAGVLIDGPLHSAPTSINWSTVTDVSYATGCYPSVAIAFYGYTPSSLSLTETHETACGSATTMESSFGYLVSK